MLPALMLCVSVFSFSFIVNNNIYIDRVIDQIAQTITPQLSPEIKRQGQDDCKEACEKLNKALTKIGDAELSRLEALEYTKSLKPFQEILDIIEKIDFDLEEKRLVMAHFLQNDLLRIGRMEKPRLQREIYYCIRRDIDNLGMRGQKYLKYRLKSHIDQATKDNQEQVLTIIYIGALMLSDAWMPKVGMFSEEACLIDLDEIYYIVGEMMRRFYIKFGDYAGNYNDNIQLGKNFTQKINDAAKNHKYDTSDIVGSNRKYTPISDDVGGEFIRTSNQKTTSDFISLFIILSCCKKILSALSDLPDTHNKTHRINNRIESNNSRPDGTHDANFHTDMSLPCTLFCAAIANPKITLNATLISLALKAIQSKNPSPQHGQRKARSFRLHSQQHTNKNQFSTKISDWECDLEYVFAHNSKHKKEHFETTHTLPTGSVILALVRLRSRKRRRILQS